MGFFSLSDDIIDPNVWPYGYTAKSKGGPLAVLEALTPEALWVPGVQTEGLRESNGSIFLESLQNFGVGGVTAAQSTESRQSELDGYQATFAFGKCYDVTANITGPITFVCRGNIGYTYKMVRLFDSLSGRIIIGSMDNSVSDVITYQINGTASSTAGKFGEVSTTIIEADVNISGDTRICNPEGPIGSGYYDAYGVNGWWSVMAIFDRYLTDSEKKALNEAIVLFE